MIIDVYPAIGTSIFSFGEDAGLVRLELERIGFPSGESWRPWMGGNSNYLLCFPPLCITYSAANRVNSFRVNLSEFPDQLEFRLGDGRLFPHTSLSSFEAVSRVSRKFKDEVQFEDIGVSVGLDEFGLAHIIEFEATYQIS